MTNQPNDAPTLASAALLLREDDHALVVRHRAGDARFPGLWSLPLRVVEDHEMAEDAVATVLRDVLHVEPGPFEFSDTFYLQGADARRLIVNVFTCVGWEGEPRYSADEYEDAAWVAPANPGSLDLVPELRAWFAEAFGAGDAEGSPAPLTPDALSTRLGEARLELLTAYEAIPLDVRTRPLDGDWSPLDTLAHAAEVEAYYFQESRRLLEQPGHIWRPFNDAQWFDIHRTRPREQETALLDRADTIRAATRAWIATLTAADLLAYGNHPERGVVQLDDRIDQIARHDREHAAQLRAMADAARVAGATTGGGGDAAATR